MVMDSHLTDTICMEPSLRVLDPILNQRLGDEKGGKGAIYVVLFRYLND
jgi:hypothetical protein